MKNAITLFYLISLFCFCTYIFIKIADLLQVNKMLACFALMVYWLGFLYVLKDEK